jgi:hypothetical protein
MLHSVCRCAFGVLVHYCAILASAQAGPPRIVPVGTVPQDIRLTELKNERGYYPFTPCSSREAWERRTSRLRRQMLVAAGLWPMPDKAPSKPAIHGLVDCGRYTVEKVILETYPGFFLTGNLYRPKGRSGKLPAVLTPFGHWPDGRFYDNDVMYGRKATRQCLAEGTERFETAARYPLQAYAVQLARMGCAVLQYDMVGRADSRQLLHNAGVRPEMNDPKRWGFCSPQAEARMQTIFGLQTYNSIRALDLLCELPDVDPARIAVMGQSGGGQQTNFLCAIDPRPAVSVPMCMVSTTCQAGCICGCASYLWIGTSGIELAALMAPKPLALIGANDWTSDVPAKGLPELKRHYSLWGAEDRVMAQSLLQFPHNFNSVSRALMYSWLNKHLKLGLEEPVLEQDFHPLSVAQSSVWDAEHPAPPGGNEFERSFLQRMTADTRRQMAALLPKDAASLAEYRRIVGGALEVMIGRGMPQPDALGIVHREIAQFHVGVLSEDIGPYHMTAFLLHYPAFNEELPVVRLDPKTWNRRAVIWIDRWGKQSLWGKSGELRPGVQALLDQGYAVVGADLLGQGEFAVDGRAVTRVGLQDRNYDANHRWDNYLGYTYGFNPPLFSQRVRDILTLVAFARGKMIGAEQVDVVGLGGAGHWVAAARAIAGPAIDRAAIDTAGFRFANLTATDDPDFLPGAVKYNDLPGMIALSAPHRFWVMGENSVSLSVASAAYDAAGQGRQLTIVPDEVREPELEAAKWLVE